MTEKRFKNMDIILLDGFIKDNITGEHISDPVSIVSKLNFQDKCINDLVCMLRESDGCISILIEIMVDLGLKDMQELRDVAELGIKFKSNHHKERVEA